MKMILAKAFVIKFNQTYLFDKLRLNVTWSEQCMRRKNFAIDGRHNTALLISFSNTRDSD